MTHLSEGFGVSAHQMSVKTKLTGKSLVCIYPVGSGESGTGDVVKEMRENVN